ncbi:unnamed protein product, partial [Pararhodospirillum photometricum DSM 122]
SRPARDPTPYALSRCAMCRRLCWPMASRTWRRRWMRLWCEAPGYRPWLTSFVRPWPNSPTCPWSGWARHRRAVPSSPWGGEGWPRRPSSRRWSTAPPVTAPTPRRGRPVPPAGWSPPCSDRVSRAPPYSRT